MTGYAPHIVRAVTGLTSRQLNYWVVSGLIIPSVQRTTTHGSRNLFAFGDIVALRTMHTLRRAGMSLQSLRRVAEHLRARDAHATFANTWLTSDGADVFERRGDELISALRRPGQAIITAFVIDLGTIATDITSEIAALKRAA